MAREQLQQAYQLIKAGRAQDGIDMLEPILRSDPNNRDAWWLLANATNDTDTKRRALNKVLELNSGDSRAQKARQMLNSLPADIFASPASSQPAAQAPQQQPYDEFGSPVAQAPQYDEFGLPVGQSQAAKRGNYDDPFSQKPQSSGPSCWIVGLAVVGVITLLCCGGTFLATTVFTTQINNFLSEMGIDIAQIQEMEAAGMSDEAIAEAMLSDMGVDVDMAELENMSEDEAAQAIVEGIFSGENTAETLDSMGVDASGLEELGLDTDSFGDAFGDSFSSFISIPDTYNDLGTVDLGQTVSGEITSGDQADGYRFTLGADATVTTTIASSGFNIPPTLFVYGPDGAYIEEAGSVNPSDDMTIAYTHNLSAGEYTFIVQPLMGLGVSPYEMRVE